MAISIPQCLPDLGRELLLEIVEHSTLKKFTQDEMIITQGQFINFVPIVVLGSVKVFSNENSTQFLLYFISAGDACIFSFAHIFNNEPIAFSAKAEIDSELLLMPIDKVRDWYTRYPRFCDLLLKAYHKHYSNLLETTKQIICYNLEDRLLTYLQQKSKIENTQLLQVSHQEIAEELGTSREVITRLMKKLNASKKTAQHGRKIKIL